ncbi:MAG TPA: pyruvate dehydrogenase (acetyl-transferring) E1 component subunit alpha [Trebonia sp.]|nr:pyruvate dehydrogenase (acetyl-transferring) E1 component subunit alpha [Trebonia sp.]
MASQARQRRAPAAGSKAADGNDVSVAADVTAAGDSPAPSRASSSTPADNSNKLAIDSNKLADNSNKPTDGQAARPTDSQAGKESGGAAPSAEQLRQYYRDMLLVRRFEERAARAYTEALIGGYCHLNLGEEAAVVGLMAALRGTDYLFTNYREHGYALMRGIDPDKVMAELYGRVDGVSKGWGGSMHMFDITHRLLGGYGIVGGQLPLATGAALAIDYRGTGDVVMCTMGDGTAAIGAFHESLNIAALWNLPVVFVVINNHLGMGTTVEHSSAEPDLYKRGAAYRMAAARVNGWDPAEVQQAATIAVETARSGHPYLLEVVTERLKGHSVVDPAKYRSAEENERLKAADPVHLYAEKLVKDEVLDELDLAEIEKEVAAIVADAAAFAANSPSPSIETLFDYTYASPVQNDSRRLPGQALFPQAPLPDNSGSVTP